MTRLEHWHQVISSQNSKDLSEIIAETAVFHSPVVHTPQKGKELTIFYLTAAFQVFLPNNFKYLREIVDGNNMVLEFTSEIDGITINGVDIIEWNEENKIVDFKVMVRPLKAVGKLQEMMFKMMESMKN